MRRLQHFRRWETTAISNSLPPTGFVEKWIVRGNYSVLAATGHQSDLIVWQHFGHHPEFIDHITVIITHTRRINRSSTRTGRRALFRKRVDNKIARLKRMGLQGEHLNSKRQRCKTRRCARKTTVRYEAPASRAVCSEAGASEQAHRFRPREV